MSHKDMKHSAIWQKHCSPSWDEITCINRIQRMILVYSILYYDYDISPLSDFEYDELAHELADTMSTFKDVKNTRFYYVFEDYNGSTGCYLRSRLNDRDQEIIDRIVEAGVRLHSGEKQLTFN